MTPPIGSHMSIAGGVDKAPALAESIGATAMQIFVKTNRSWKSPQITSEQAVRFREELDRICMPIGHVFAHTSYLINLAAIKPDVLTKSVDALVDELERCEKIGVPGLVLHPGSHVGEGVEKGTRQIIEKTREVLERTPGVHTRILFETTAGQGTNIGATFEEIAALLSGLNRPDRIGVCMDTCHIFAAGYDIRTPEAYDTTMAEFDRMIGLEHLRAIHLNDSQKPFASKRDRHAHIGQGEIGEEAFRLILNDPRLAEIPMSLETDKEKDLEEDRMNMRTLRRLAGEKVE